MQIEQRHETARLTALAEALEKRAPLPVEAQCETNRSDDWLALVAACNEKEMNND